MVSINFVGDVALFGYFERRSIDPLRLAELPASNFNVANFEFPAPSDSLAKAYFDVDDAYRMSSEYSRSLELEKFHLYGLANNHVMDYGPEGISETCRLLRSAGSRTFGVGTGRLNTATMTSHGVTVLIIGVVKRGRWSRSAGQLGPDPYDMNAILSLIAHKKHVVDHIIVFPHWGTELVDAPDPQDVFNARRLIDAGARCVIGHHPHVPQGCEVYRSGLIAYSLGSFIYLPDLEKGNVDRSPERDISICLNVTFTKDRISAFTPFKYIIDREKMVPVNRGDFRLDPYYQELCARIGDKRYYSKKVRTVLVRREIASFWVRFKEKPFRALVHYVKYVKLAHLRKVFGL